MAPEDVMAAGHPRVRASPGPEFGPPCLCPICWKFGSLGTLLPDCPVLGRIQSWPQGVHRTLQGQLGGQGGRLPTLVPATELQNCYCSRQRRGRPGCWFVPALGSRGEVPQAPVQWSLEDRLLPLHSPVSPHSHCSPHP